MTNYNRADILAFIGALLLPPVGGIIHAFYIVYKYREDLRPIGGNSHHTGDQDMGQRTVEIPIRYGESQTTTTEESIPETKGPSASDDVGTCSTPLPVPPLNQTRPEVKPTTDPSPPMTTESIHQSEDDGETEKNVLETENIEAHEVIITPYNISNGK
ncbi:hypothetical protein G9A89_005705 [Geosiphon pyriformis]|nr:hypothetical protein G9A89_005705 [Geosiphon pyriformis]